MVKKLFIGVDLGTTYLKVGVYDRNGNVSGYSFQELNLFNPKAGQFFQNPNEFYRKTLQGIKKCISEASLSPKDIKGIGFDGQSGGIMAIDYEFNPVIDYDIIIDDRAKKYSKLLNETHKELVYKHTVCSSTYGEKVIYWSRNSEVSKKIYKFIQPADFVSGRLCGLKGDDAFMGFSYLCWSGLCDAETLNWAKELCDRFDIDMKKLPRIVDTFEIIGYLDEENAKECGLVSGIPVIAGGGDASVTLMGAGLNRPGKSAILSGTANGIFHVVDKIYPKNKYKLFHQYSVFRKLKMLLNFDMSGRSHFWFNRTFLSDGNTEDSFLNMEKKISNIPQCSEKLLFFPNFSGIIWPFKPYIRGGLLGLDFIHKKGHLYKSILEAIAFNRHLDLLKIKETCEYDESEKSDIIFIGGGAKSITWGQIFSDVLGTKVIKYKRNDFTTVGSAFIAAKAISEIESITDSIEAYLKIDRIFYPDEKKHRKYIEYIEIYKEANEALEDIFLKLNGFKLD